ncbi:hypothetical protein N8T08_007125 [Aspergillus melleus]|uniref:Uncharacterized protein n=1 Tax=Aspergillus melleus TaxID=138277 RepID=A0ACC3AYQ5_9EURO|nr:hypothetical protein N8T08_007125 [Aspergillus melleus]
MEYDDVAWEQSDQVFDDFKKKITSPDVLLAVTRFMASLRDWVRPIDRARIAGVGAFNLCFRRPRGIPDWTETYRPRLETFLRVLKCREDAAIADGILVEGQRMSERMRESWEHGDVWVNYSARKSWALDDVWPMIDAKLFGGDALLHGEERLKLLGEEDREAMGPFIQKKLEDRKQRKLDGWDP